MPRTPRTPPPPHLSAACAAHDQHAVSRRHFKRQLREQHPSRRRRAREVAHLNTAVADVRDGRSGLPRPRVQQRRLGTRRASPRRWRHDARIASLQHVQHAVTARVTRLAVRLQRRGHGQHVDAEQARRQLERLRAQRRAECVNDLAHTVREAGEVPHLRHDVRDVAHSTCSITVHTCSVST
jgi:hypothetical protein